MNGARQTMARFDFRLQILLTLRHHERANRRAELAAAVACENEIDERRRFVDAELEGQRQYVRAGTAPGRITLENLQSAAAYERALRDQLAQVVASHEAAAVRVAQAQQALAEAESEVRALEKLRERQFGEFALDQSRLEARRLDEVGARAHYS
jgi:flagellar export protein FliJ